jgi:hypothetical protein
VISGKGGVLDLSRAARSAGLLREGVSEPAPEADPEPAIHAAFRVSREYPRGRHPRTPANAGLRLRCERGGSRRKSTPAITVQPEGVTPRKRVPLQRRRNTP